MPDLPDRQNVVVGMRVIILRNNSMINSLPSARVFHDAYVCH